MPDFFEEIIKRDSTATQIVGGGGASPTGTYFTIANNLAEGNIPQIRLNLGLSEDDIPTFNQLDLNSEGTTETSAVRADRRIVASAGLQTIGNDNLTDDISIEMTTPLSVGVDTQNTVTGGSSEVWDLSTEVWDLSTEEFGPDSHTHALDLSGRTLTAGGGLTGLGNLGADRTVNMGTPSTLTVSSSNSTTATSHNHELDLSGRSVDTTGVLSGGGNLGQDRTLSLSFSDPIYNNNGSLDLRISDPLFLDGNSLSVQNHGNGQKGVILPTAQTIHGEKTLQDNLVLRQNIDSYIGSGSFTKGFDGAGTRYGFFDSSWRQELDDLFIRGSLFANEFIINQILALNGSDILSPGRGKIEEISGASPNEVIEVSDPQGNDIASFVAGDIVIVQQVTPDAFNGGGQIIKRIVRRVASVTGATVSLESLSGAPTDGGSIEEGDVIVALGNTTDAGRQATIYRSVIDSGSPYVRVNDGVSSWNDWISADKAKLQYGNLEGLPFIESVLGKIYGFWAEDNLFLTAGQDNPMAFGKDAGGAGLHGIHINSDNKWYGNGQLQIGGANGLNHFPSQTFDTSTETWDSSGAYWNAPIQLGSDVYIDGNAQIAGDAVVDGTLTVSKLDFQENGRIIGEKLSIDTNTTFTDDVQIKGTLQGVKGVFEGDLLIGSGTGRMQLSQGKGVQMPIASATGRGALKWYDGDYDNDTNVISTVFALGSGDINIQRRVGGDLNEVVNIGGQRTTVSNIMRVSNGVEGANLATTDQSDGITWYVDSNGFVKVSSGAPTAPSTPTNLTMEKDRTADAMYVSWDSVADADDYELQRSTDNSTWTTVKDNSATSYLDSVPFSNKSTTYYYRVRAKNAGGASAYSSSINNSWNNATNRYSLNPTGVFLSLSGSLSSVSWITPDSGNPSDYTIQYKINTGNFNILQGGVSGSATSYEFDVCSFASNNDDVQIRVIANYSSPTESGSGDSNTETVSQCL